MADTIEIAPTPESIGCRLRVTKLAPWPENKCLRVDMSNGATISLGGEQWIDRATDKPTDVCEFSWEWGYSAIDQETDKFRCVPMVDGKLIVDEKEQLRKVRGNEDIYFVTREKMAADPNGVHSCVIRRLVPAVVTATITAFQDIEADFVLEEF